MFRVLHPPIIRSFKRCASAVLARQCIARVVVGLTDGVRCELQTCTIRYGITWSRYKPVDAESSANRVLCVCSPGASVYRACRSWINRRSEVHLVFEAPDDGWVQHPKHVERRIKWNKILKIVASSWCVHLMIYDARNHETETHRSISSNVRPNYLSRTKLQSGGLLLRNVSEPSVWGFYTRSILTYISFTRYENSVVSRVCLQVIGTRVTSDQLYKSFSQYE